MNAACESCRHSFPEAGAPQLTCRRFPPSAHPLVATHPVTQQPSLQVLSLFPTVARDAECGEFVAGEPKLRVVS